MSGKTLRLVIVTPERTLLDEPVSALRFPLYDGEFGVLPGRAPVVGRLGFGELKLTGVDDKSSGFFIDGGFLQIQASTVTLLTQRAIPVEEISSIVAQKELQSAQDRVAKTDDEYALKARDVSRAKKLLGLVRTAAK